MGCVVVWISVLKMKFLDTEYKGTLFVTFKYLSPVRTRVLLQIAAYTAPFLLFDLMDLLYIVLAGVKAHTLYLNEKQMD